MIKPPSRTTAIIAPLLYLITTGKSVAAQDKIVNPVIDEAIGTGAGDLGTSAPQLVAIILARFFSAALGAGSVMLLIYLVISAFRWLTARDTGGVENARQGIFNAIIGIVILASIFAIARLVGVILGIPGYPDTIPWPTFDRAEP